MKEINWCCRECGESAKGSYSVNKMSTYRMKKCDVCGEEKHVTGVEAFGCPDFHKKCSKCETSKLISEYYYRNDTCTIRNECKQCMKYRTMRWARDRYNDPNVKAKREKYYKDNRTHTIKKSKKWAENNKDKRRLYCASWRWKLRMEIIKEYGGECVCCGESQPEFMQIDHVNNDGWQLRKENKQLVGGSLYRWLKLNNFPKDNFQLLCCNCNFAKGHFGGCPHND